MSLFDAAIVWMVCCGTLVSLANHPLAWWEAFSIGGMSWVITSAYRKLMR